MRARDASITELSGVRDALMSELDEKKACVSQLRSECWDLTLTISNRDRSIQEFEVMHEELSADLKEKS